MKRCLTFAVLTVGALVGACGGSSIDCSEPGLFIIAQGVNVTSMVLGGPACEVAAISSTVPVPNDAAISLNVPVPTSPSAVARNTGFEPGGWFYVIMPSQVGDCTVAVGLDSGVVLERAVTFTRAEGACAGYYTHDRNWRLLDWPLDAGVD
jgi:hypothetical protein